MNSYRRALSHVLPALAVPAASGCDVYPAAGDTVGKTIPYQVERSGSTMDACSNRGLAVECTTNGGLQQQKGVLLPSTKVVGVASSGLEASVTAQLDGIETVACRIVADSEVIEQQTSREDSYPAVKCST